MKSEKAIVKSEKAIVKSEKAIVKSEEVMSVVFGLLSHTSVHLSVCLSFGVAVPLVVKLFASAKSHLHLYVLSRKIHGKGNKGISLLSDETSELHDLTLMHEQLSVASRLSVEDIALFIWTYVHSKDEKLSVFE